MQGLDITIENHAGELRHGKDWIQKMAHDYGYINGMTGADGDEMDVFIGPNPDAKSLYVVEQNNEDGNFDEHKIMAGFSNIGEAKDAYHANYPKGWNGMKNISEVKNDEFRGWYEGLAGYQNTVVTKKAKDLRSKLVSDYEGLAGDPDFKNKKENTMKTLNAKGAGSTPFKTKNEALNYKMKKEQEGFEGVKLHEDDGFYTVSWLSGPKENSMQDTYRVGTHNRDSLVSRGKSSYGSKIDNSVCECPVCMGGKRFGMFACKNCKGEGTIRNDANASRLFDQYCSEKGITGESDDDAEKLTPNRILPWLAGKGIHGNEATKIMDIWEHMLGA